MNRNNHKKDDRIYLRLSSDLKAKVQEYANRKRTTVSELTIRFFTQLLEEDERLRHQPVDADQV